MKLLSAVKIVFLGMYVLVFAACGSDDAVKTNKTAVVVAKSENPFPFYRSIEIKPGYYFEIVSWGRGIDSVGGYLLLMSDSVKNNYRSLSIERKGIITDAWNMDLDNDGNPELYIQYVVRKNVNDLNVYEFNSNSFEKISFPGLNADLKKGYDGNDKFFVRNGGLFRSVPVTLSNNDKIVKKIEYKLNDNRFSTKEVKPE
ncbi:hypothetical protein [Pedobacter insulae]|uniref:NigD-like protein n=1 Tax=Pedobacter insulae TaxID=414048 RepID=A0A1I2UV76_9SPHI|nr:hypothetical protein [Pedobacter insulae]SFG78661.1 hypothetical protein SAMN04489864_102260 [Pedobacter insulae]